MAVRERCPNCGGPILANAPKAQCPACLVREGSRGRSPAPADFSEKVYEKVAASTPSPQPSPPGARGTDPSSPPPRGEGARRADEGVIRRRPDTSRTPVETAPPSRTGDGASVYRNGCRLPASREAGRVIGVGATLNERFTLDAELGQGGMGTVYRATDQLLGRNVAIKFLKDARSEEEAKKLRLEAQILARLVHDRIVRLYDYGESGGITSSSWRR